jgi:hypothetical protein
MTEQQRDVIEVLEHDHPPLGCRGGAREEDKSRRKELLREHLLDLATGRGMH